MKRKEVMFWLRNYYTKLCSQCYNSYCSWEKIEPWIDFKINLDLSIGRLCKEERNEVINYMNGTKFDFDILIKAVDNICVGGIND